METFFWGYHFEEFSSIGPISVSYNREPCGSLTPLLDHTGFPFRMHGYRLRMGISPMTLFLEVIPFKVSFFPMVFYSVTWFIWVYLI